MSLRRRIVLTILFVSLTAGGGAILIRPDLISGERTMFIPLALVAAYGLLVTALTAGVRREEPAEHYIDSIYFLGFLFTLFSLGALFYRLSHEELLLTGDAVFMTVLYYVGVSVTTSIAGVLFRTIVRGIVLSGSPEETEDVEKTYELLQSVAKEFSHNSKESFEAMRLFLQERSEGISLLEERERAYIESLEKLTETSRRFSESLSSAEGEVLQSIEGYSRALAGHREQVEEFARLGNELASCSERLHRETRELPLAGINSELREFKNGARELNTVIDSVVTLLERKVEKVGS